MINRWGECYRKRNEQAPLGEADFARTAGGLKAGRKKNRRGHTEGLTSNLKDFPPQTKKKVGSR